MNRLNQKGFSHHLLLVAIILVAAIVGGGFYVKNHHKSNLLKSEQEATNLATPLPSTIFGIDQIKHLATEKAGGKAISAIALAKEDNRYIYKIRLEDGTVLVFSATDGKQLNRNAKSKAEDQKDTEASDDLPKDFTAAISFDQARTIAVGTHAGTIDGIELEGEGKSVVYKIEFTDGTRVMINANSGAVLNVKASKKAQKSHANSGKSEGQSPPNPSDNRSSSDSGSGAESDDESSGSGASGHGSGRSHESGGSGGSDESGSGGGNPHQDGGHGGDSDDN